MGKQSPPQRRACLLRRSDHIRKPYAVVQANSRPDFLVFAALVPKLLGCRIVAYMQEPTPELAATILNNKWITGFLTRVEQWAIQFADHIASRLHADPARRAELARNGKLAQWSFLPP